MVKLDKIVFIEKAINVHGLNYDYSKVEYINSKIPVIIICKTHNIEIKQKPSKHLQGYGCKLCSGKLMNSDEFIKKGTIKHNNYYNYSLVEYINTLTKVIIICPIHGQFEQIPGDHLQGKGCPKCNGKQFALNDIINKCVGIHNNKYDYSKLIYNGVKEYTLIICPEHGEFNQSLDAHLRGQGCPKCANKNVDTKFFIEKAEKVHNYKLDYSSTIYINSKSKIKIICPIHGEFKQSPDKHLQGQGCRKCSNNGTSIMEENIKKFISDLNIDFIENSKNIIKPLELDIYIPSNNLAIEFDGLYWHNELHKPNDYHLNKTKECQSNNIQLIHIFEDEWMFKENIVKSRIKNILGLTQNRIYGRKCIIKEVNIKDSKLFLDNNHIQGKVNSSINIGLYYNNELVSLMCFNKPRSGIGSKYDGYELSRFCNKLDTTVIGSASKLLKYFENMYQPKEIKSYADLRWSEGNLYKTLGFELNHINEPNYWYIINNQRKHRFNYRKSLLINEGFDASKTEREIMFERGIYRIYDCGTLSYSKKQLTVLS